MNATFEEKLSKSLSLVKSFVFNALAANERVTDGVKATHLREAATSSIDMAIERAIGK